MNGGKVYLVGAGPGDPGLLTVKAVQCLKRAQVIVYDRLVSSCVRNLASPEAEWWYAGKSSRIHTLSQKEICRKLVELARSGLCVVRLKGGDPFVFGRGGEEAEELAAAGIPFEIVPGITSAVSVPAYAGIPLTHRGHASSFAVITGHEAGDRRVSRLDYAGFAGSADTLVFLMGVENLEVIARELQRGGLPPDHPAALIRRGTLSEQQTVTGTLGDIYCKAVEREISPPAVLVVGEVAKLRERLHWKERLPLHGKRVVVTRPADQAHELSSRIEELGGEAWEFPVIKIVPPDSWSPVDLVLSSLDSYSWLIFTSTNGADCFFRRMHHNKMDVRCLAGLKLAAIGPRTCRSLEERGFRVDLVPSEYRAECVAETMVAQVERGEKVLLPRAQEAREVLPKRLREAGIPVDEVPVYRTLPGDADAASMRRMLEEGRVEVITFTSSSTVRQFFAKVGEDATGLLKEVTLASIGPITGCTIREMGLVPQVQAREYTIDGLMEALLEHYCQTPQLPSDTTG